MTLKDSNDVPSLGTISSGSWVYAPQKKGASGVGGMRLISNWPGTWRDGMAGVLTCQGIEMTVLPVEGGSRGDVKPPEGRMDSRGETDRSDAPERERVTDRAGDGWRISGEAWVNEMVVEVEGGGTC
jgi:hypothetical protein